MVTLSKVELDEEKTLFLFLHWLVNIITVSHGSCRLNRMWRVMFVTHDSDRMTHDSHKDVRVTFIHGKNTVTLLTAAAAVVHILMSSMSEWCGRSNQTSKWNHNSNYSTAVSTWFLRLSGKHIFCLSLFSFVPSVQNIQVSRPLIFGRPDLLSLAVIN